MENANPPPPASPTPSSPLPSPASPNPYAARNWAMWCHLSALSGFVGVPFGNILGPLILWQMKRNEFPEVDHHGKEALNFHISVWIYLVVGGIAAFVGTFACGLGLLLIPVLAVIGLGSIVLSIIGGIKANDGVAYRYPLTIRFLR